MLFKAQRLIEQKISNYCETALRCVKEGIKVLIKCMEAKECEEWREMIHEVHRAESSADDLRREIEYFLFSRSLFPESRGDILGLLEKLDRIPNQIQSSVKMVLEEQIRIPDLVKEELEQIAITTEKCVDITIKSVNLLFSDFKSSLELLGEIDAYESEVDRFQSKAIEKIFSSDLDPLQKILLRDLVNEISFVTNYAEEAGDFMRIIIVKRMI
ncbi:MAG: DUF47 family protein [Candidatus Hydrogenedentes bacterium]|nr:DUF47 family protein [Candidatus Hydrogenedentota bacterium]